MVSDHGLSLLSKVFFLLKRRDWTSLGFWAEIWGSQGVGRSCQADHSQAEKETIQTKNVSKLVSKWCHPNLEIPMELCLSQLRSRVEKLTRSSLKGFFNRALFAYKNGCFESSFLFLDIGVLQASKKANFSFKSPSPKPHLNRTGSVFALPIRDVNSWWSERHRTYETCWGPPLPFTKKRGRKMPERCQNLPKGVVWPIFPRTPTLKTVTSLNKEARLLKFHFS